MNEAATIATENLTRQLPPLIEFRREPVEDVAASKKAGHYVAKDVDYVIITTRNGKGDSVIWEFDTFKANWEAEVRANRLPQQWLDRALANYEKFKSGQDIPLDGIPIRGWGVISPAQQEMLIHLNIKTVEHLASINDEARLRIGMGALDLQRKAQAWLSQLKDKGPATMEIAALKQENELQRGQIETLARQVQELTAELRQAIQRVPLSFGGQASSGSGPIDVKDILDEVRGQPVVEDRPQKRHRRTRAEMEAARVTGPVADGIVPKKEAEPVGEI